ncbi:MAG: hypothetical protein U5K76_08420 [Woeseiaceae bacterium]|nr:hypothetical protein [Woeseiaceae bacterium]
MRPRREPSFLRPAHRRLARGAVLLALVFAPPVPAQPAPGLYTVDSAASHVHVRVYRAGLLRGLGHNHIVAHRNITGCLRVAPTLPDSVMALEFPLAGLVVDDRALREAAGEAFPVPVPPEDIAATRRNMLGADLLAAAAHPLATVTARRIAGQYPSVEAEIDIGLRGAQHVLAMPVHVRVDSNSIVAEGKREVHHAELGLEPFTAAFGALRVAGAMDFEYRLAFRPADEEAGHSACERAAPVIDNDRIARPDDTAK